jgi:hypothetical protein
MTDIDIIFEPFGYKEYSWSSSMDKNVDGHGLLGHILLRYSV